MMNDCAMTKAQPRSSCRLRSQSTPRTSCATALPRTSWATRSTPEPGSYVILGAGLDSFCLRQGDRADRLRVFEVNHPASQSMKRDKLLRINDHLPANLVVTPVDFGNRPPRRGAH